MSEVATLHSAADLRRRGNTFRAMLQDDLGAFELLRDLTRDDQALSVINAQIEAINEVLTDGAEAD